jgi:hypothetical protein
VFGLFLRRLGCRFGLAAFVSDGARSGQAEQRQNGQDHDDYTDDVENAVHGSGASSVGPDGGCYGR